MFRRDPTHAALRELGDVLGRDLGPLRSRLRAALPRGGVVAAACAGRQAVTALDHPRGARDALFELASVSKPFTAALAAELVRAGQLDWHAPLAALGGPLRAAPRHVTAWRLATHTAGLPTHPARAAVTVLTRFHDPYGGMDARAVLGSVRRWAGPPGRFRYSNLGVGALALACAVAAGEPCSAAGYGRALRRHVSGPLNLHVTLDPPAPAAGAGQATAFGPLAGAGGLFATPPALLTFAQAHLDGRLGDHWVTAERPPGLPAGLAVTAGWLARGPLRWHDGVARQSRAGLAFHAGTGAAVAVLARGGLPLLGGREAVTRLLLQLLD
ncbi:serine hydrolase domain-containing protein [Deinococcus depolymerans]|uniref:Serine hydrolase domain-containing protein n=1 Tax=Deinococcus depolymerans TaxID=392408 RepID=A0ABP3M097_9DEIO